MTEEYIDDFEQELESLSKKEIIAFRSFEASYREIYPVPVKPVISENLKKDWKFVTSVITALVGTLLAAFRTGGAFYAAAVYEYQWTLSLIEAVSAVLAIEGSLVLYSVRVAYERKETNDQTGWALFTAFAISVLAGLNQSVNILSSDSSDMFAFVLKWLLVVFMGIGATIIAWLSGHTLGVQLVRFENENRSSLESYEKAVHGYRANMLKNWRTSYELSAVNERKNDRYRTPSTNIVHERTKSDRSPNSSSERSPRTNTNGASKNEIFSILDTVFTNEQRIAGVSEIARTIASARNRIEYMEQHGGAEPEAINDDGFHRYKGVVSEQRKQWMVGKGFIDQDGNIIEKGVQG